MEQTDVVYELKKIMNTRIKIITFHLKHLKKTLKPSNEPVTLCFGMMVHHFQIMVIS